MVGTDDSIALLGDWRFLNHSPRAFFSSFVSDAFYSGPVTDLSTVNENEMSSMEPQERVTSDCDSLYKVVDDGIEMCNIKRGGLAERMASRAGFSVPKLNIWQIGSASLGCSSPSVKSSFITIPPGLSPTVLLDSPALPSNLVNAHAAGQHMSGDEVPIQFQDIDQDVKKEVYDTDSQSVEKTQLHSDFVIYSEWVTSSNDSTIACNTLNEVTDTKQFSTTLDRMDPGDQKGELNSASLGQQEEDGYNWKKYGQKHVKGSEYPRSYYKCTHTDCPVKKKVERSQEGNITDVIYKGVHNHPKPPTNRRTLGLLASQCMSELQNDGTEHGQNSSMEILTSSQNGTSSLDEGSKPSSSVSIIEESCDPLSVILNSLGKSHDHMDITPTISVEDDDGNQATQRNLSIVDGSEGDELESKRRKMDCSSMDSCTAPGREPRIVVQTTSEVDILDDGYRWRKYGQKVVKGNPNPRSYYKCTSAGCNVRKHVERASHDLKSVITTYEGKHNHEVPVARNNNLGTGGTSGSSTTSLLLHSHDETGLLEQPQAEDMVRILEPLMTETKPAISSASCLNISVVPGGPQLNVPGGVPSFRLSQFNLANILMYGFNHPLNACAGYSFENKSEPVMSSGESTMDSVPIPNAELVYEQIMRGLQLDLGH